MKLVIVESPNKCATIKNYLGNGFEVVASQGHIRDLSTHGKGGLGINVEEDYKPDFVIKPNQYATVKKLKAQVAQSEEVILATDPDREGEAISWHLAVVLGLDPKTTKRLSFHEITRPAIQEAMEHPSHIDMNLVYAQETRRMYDRIIGFKLSSLLQRKMGSKSAGRVQSATLKLIVENDDEIKSFVPKEFWSVSVELNLEDGKTLIVALDKVDGKNPEIHNKEEAEAILKRIGDSMKIVSLTSTKRSILSKFPFTTSTLQQEAYNRFKFSTSKTQSIAQLLYEGRQIQGEHVGLITYMRTDSTRISEDFYQNNAKPYILEHFGKEYLGYIKQAEKKKERVQDAHEAIRPTSTLRTPETVAQYLSPDEAKLYRLIYDRALASLMTPKVEEVTTAIWECNGLTFKASGTRTLFPGYSVIYGEFEAEENKKLPPLEEGKSYSVKKRNEEQKFTQPPARFTEAKVVKAMEEKGIGRPSTYANTIKTLKSHDYISIVKGVVTPTETGIRTTKVMEKFFPEIISASYTAKMENELDEVAEKKKTRLEAMDSFYRPFIEKFDQVQKTMYKDSGEPTGEMCPECGSPLIYKKGKFGKFVACSNYPACHYVVKEKMQETGETCPRCGRPLVVRKSKKGEEFVGCSGYPSCTYIKGQEEKKLADATKYTEADYVKECPSCHQGHLVVKHGKKVDFLGCTNYPKCRYHEWLTVKKGKK